MEFEAELGVDTETQLQSYSTEQFDLILEHNAKVENSLNLICSIAFVFLIYKISALLYKLIGGWFLGGL